MRFQSQFNEPRTKRSCSPEYLALIGSFFLIGLEIIIRLITLALRKKVS